MPNIAMMRALNTSAYIPEGQRFAINGPPEPFDKIFVTTQSFFGALSLEEQGLAAQENHFGVLLWLTVLFEYIHSSQSR